MKNNLGPSPLNTAKEQATLEDAIQSINDIGFIGKGTVLWAKREILAERLSMARDGVGFTAGYSNVTKWQAQDKLVEMGY